MLRFTKDDLDVLPHICLRCDGGSVENRWCPGCHEHPGSERLHNQCRDCKYQFLALPVDQIYERIQLQKQA